MQNEARNLTKVLLPFNRNIRQKLDFHSIVTYFRNWFRDCEICIQVRRKNNTRISPELTHIPAEDLGLEDLMQIDLLPQLQPSGAYDKIIATIDVFSKYAFAYPVSNLTAKNTATVIIDIMTRHAYLPTFIKKDKGSVCVSQVVHEVAEKLGIYLKHTTTKHAETIGVLERDHATTKFSLKMASSEYQKKWHKYLPFATLNYKKTYQYQADYFMTESHIMF